MNNELSEETIIRTATEFPNCIECGWDEPVTFFHRQGCRRGAGLSADELLRRIHIRAEQLRPMEENQVLMCRDCTNTATGTGWVTYHNYDVLIEHFPLCDNHSDFTDPSGRPHGFIPNVVTINRIRIERILSIQEKYG